MNLLSDETLLNILQHVTLKDIMHLFLVNNHFNDICSDEHLWKIFLLRDFKNTYSQTNHNSSYKLLYRQQYLKESYYLPLKFNGDNEKRYKILVNPNISIETFYNIIYKKYIEVCDKLKPYILIRVHLLPAVMQTFLKMESESQFWQANNNKFF